ncbi:hypothetical protein [Foetidibacter luteolus]|uniref:hypothetical protein n=1 Tax=Foetidibacter luteolus TaxID=2608880 RepID=UPI00129A1AFA|nr:hypothetical protein [Foetidibacter luteolus]
MVYLFNLAGYPLLFGYLGRQSSARLAGKIEQNSYHEADLVEVKVKLNMPYYNSQEAYEPLAGDITINGNHYNYVKRKVWQDTLFLMCLPNKERDNLQTAKKDYASAANDFDDEKPNKGITKKENGFSLYHAFENDYSLKPLCTRANVAYTFICVCLPQSYVGAYDIPPEVFS